MDLNHPTDSRRNFLRTIAYGTAGLLAARGTFAQELSPVFEATLPGDHGQPDWLYTPTEAPDPHRSYWLVVGAHGVGENGRGACGISSLVKHFEDVIVLGPSFTQPPADPAAAHTTGIPKVLYQMSGPTSEAHLLTQIERISRWWRLQPRIILHGFSAGAQFVHRFAFKHPEQVAGVAAHSAGTWAGQQEDDPINPAARQIPFALSCGDADTGKAWPGAPLPRLEGCHQFAKELEQQGFDVSLRTWPQVAHTLTPMACAQTRKLVEKVRQRADLGRTLLG